MSDNEIINIDSRSHLEVADSLHRYSKNLRYYFKEYNRMFGCGNIIDSTEGNSVSTPSRSRWSRYDPFFRWLDESIPKPDLSCCPRSSLDSDIVTYLNSDADRMDYEVEISRDGMLKSRSTKEPLNTGSKGWIFVLKQSKMYACEKRTSSPRLQHSSFFAGEVVNAAGMIVCENGVLTTLYPHSGHYRPMNNHLCSLLRFLLLRGINLKEVQVDVQRVFKTPRQKDSDGSKVKKTDTPYFKDGDFVYNFLKSKQSVIQSGFLFQIETMPLLKKITQLNSIDSNNAEDSSLGIVIPTDNSIPISSAATTETEDKSDKPWFNVNYDPPSECSSPNQYGSFLTSSFMESFSHGSDSTSNSASFRARVLNKHLNHSGLSSNHTSSAKDVALLLAESPSMAILSASNGSSRAHTPGGYGGKGQFSRIRTLSEASRHTHGSYEDLASQGIIHSGSRDVVSDSQVGSMDKYDGQIVGGICFDSDPPTQSIPVIDSQTKTSSSSLLVN